MVIDAIDRERIVAARGPAAMRVRSFGPTPLSSSRMSASETSGTRRPPNRRNSGAA